MYNPVQSIDAVVFSVSCVLCTTLCILFVLEGFCRFTIMMLCSFAS